MKGQARNVMIGVFVLAAILLVIWLVLFLHPSVGDGQESLRVRFTDIEKISLGTRVQYAGKPVGQVVKINEIRDAREQPQPEDSARQLYVYELILGVDSSVQVYDTDEVLPQTTGLFGEKVINIVPMRPPAGVTPVPITNQVIYAHAGDQMQDLIRQVTTVAKKIGDTFTSINTLLESDGAITVACDSMCELLEEMRTTFNDVNESGMIASVKGAADNLADAMDTIDRTLVDLENEKFWPTAKEALANVGDAADCFGTLATDITDGKGTLGRLIKEDELYLQTLDLMSKGNTFLNDVNHYGVLFQFNKGWQRKRTKRADQIQKLRTPAAFGQYFNCEVDQIRTALSRIQMMIDRAECECNLSCNGCFISEFETLLNQVRNLEKRLEAYNQELTHGNE